MAQATTQTRQQPVYLQGIEVPAESINPTLFFQLTRRKQTQEKSFAFAAVAIVAALVLASVAPGRAQNGPAETEGPSKFIDVETDRVPDKHVFAVRTEVRGLGGGRLGGGPRNTAIGVGSGRHGIGSVEFSGGSESLGQRVEVPDPCPFGHPRLPQQLDDICSLCHASSPRAARNRTHCGRRARQGRRILVDPPPGHRGSNEPHDG